MEGTSYKKECSMCGDIGFSSELIQCKKCVFRWQHTYCSKMYPNIGYGEWVCDWCFEGDLKEREEKETRKQTHIDALEFLLEVAESAAFNGGSVERQACSSKRTSARKLSRLKKQKWGLISERMNFDPAGKPWDVSKSKTINRRYKLLSDV